MPSKSKIKGNTFEREIVNKCESVGVPAKRAWGSNGQSLGMHEEVDVLVDRFKVQAKRRKRLGKLFKPSEHVDVQMVREDRDETYVIMKLDKWLDLVLDAIV